MSKKDLIQKAEEMILAPSCYIGAKAAAMKWINAIGSEGEKAAAEALIKELEADVLSIDRYLTIQKEMTPFILGKEKAEEMYEKGMNAKADGGKWCLCAACQAGGIILENKKLLL